MDSLPCNEFQNASVLNWFRCYPWSLFLPRLNFLLFLDQHCVVMGVGTQVIISMFDDNQITVAAQLVTSINNAAICDYPIIGPVLCCPRYQSPCCPLRSAQRFRSLCPQSAQRQVEIGVLVGVLSLTVGSVVLCCWYRYRRSCTVVAVGLLFGNILLALCSPEDSEYVIGRLRRNSNGGILCRLDHNSLLCCVGL